MKKSLVLEKEAQIFENLKAQLKENGKETFITDGIICFDEYKKSFPKILWINKEVNSEDEDESWDLREALFNLEENGKVKLGWEKTFDPIIYIIFGIMNRANYDDIPFTRQDPSIIQNLQKIAYINLKKTPGISVAKKNELTDFHFNYSDTLESQIRLYNPDIIICGNTYHLLENSLTKIYDAEKNMQFIIDDKDKANIFFYNKDVLIIDAYHPSHRTNKQIYCDGIINGALKWLEYKKA